MTTQESDGSFNADLVEEQDMDESNNIVHLVPTSHISEGSSDKVKSVIGDVQPDLIAVELDEDRLQKLKQQASGDEPEMSLTTMLMSDEIPFKSKVMLYPFSKLQSLVSSKAGVSMAGIDMLAGVEESEERNIPLGLVDQDIKHTFNRFAEEVSVLHLMKMMVYFIHSYIVLTLFGSSDPKEAFEVESMDIDQILEAMEDVLPTFKTVFVDERNTVIAERITALLEGELDELGNISEIVLVIGAGHEPGIKEILRENTQITVISH